MGALAFLDAKDGRLVVLPGDSPADAWARYTASPESETGRASVPPVLTFVHRADVPKAPETVTRSALQQQQDCPEVAALETELRDAHRRARGASWPSYSASSPTSMAATKQEADMSLAAARADMQTALTSLSDELATVRKFMLQTAQLGWLNHELNVENASGIAEGGDGQPGAVRELGNGWKRPCDSSRRVWPGSSRSWRHRLDTIQGKVSSLK